MKVYVILDQTSDEEGDVFESIYKTSNEAVLRCIGLVRVKSSHYNISGGHFLKSKLTDRYGKNKGIDYGYINNEYTEGIHWVCTLLEYEVIEKIG